MQTVKPETAINVAIDLETKAKLKEHLATRGATVSAFMRSLITEYLENNAKSEEAQ